ARMRSESGLYYGMDFLQSATGPVHLYVRMCADRGSTGVQTVSLSCRSLSCGRECVCVCVCVCVRVCVCVCLCAFTLEVPLYLPFRQTTQILCRFLKRHMIDCISSH